MLQPSKSLNITAMSGAKNGTRLVSSLARRQLFVGPTPCAKRFASTESEKPSANKVDDLSELDQQSSFLTPSPDNATVQAFNTAERLAARDRQLPGTR
jgi:large subunit ribosomal protein L5